VLTSDDFPVRITHRDLLWLDTGNAPIHVTGLPGDKDKAAADTQEQQFLGSLILAPDREGRLAVILAAPIEEILRGVVPAETYPSAPLDALKVQAVAARGTILAQIGARHLADPFHLCNKQHCQVFKGLAATTESTDKAVAQTRGQVLMHDRHIAETFYSSNCGGQSETPDDVWGQSPRAYLTAHLDAASSGAPATDIDALLKTTPSGAWCNTQAFGSGKHFRWEQRLSAADLQRHVNAKHDIGPILDLKILARGKGGRAMQMEIKGQKGTVVVERELAIRRVFGGLKSALFTLDIAYDKKGRVEEVTFKGAGFGHGVGMCQTGAMGMAQAGHDHKKILNHYYPGTKLDALW
jgi:stage II sporulation protein D